MTTEQLSELQELAEQINRGVNALTAIHAAMEQGLSTPESWLPGLWFCCDHLGREADKLHTMAYKTLDV